MQMDDWEPEAPTEPPLEPLRPLVADARWTSAHLAVPLIADSHAFYADWTALQGQAPYAVYHYTDASGLNEVLESGRIWASDILYLAGSRELDYARDLVRTHVRQRANVSDPVLRQFCDKAEGALDPLNWQRSLFAACFCENGDALGQWRAYAGPRGGYAIGLRTSAMTSSGSRYHGAALRRVIYDPERQKALIDALLDRAMVLLRWSGSGGAAAIDIVLEFLADHMIELLASFKQPAFRDDNEWRLLLIADTAYAGETLSEVRFRRAGGHIVPYVELDVSPRAGAYASPIAEVICGPLERAELSARAIALLLKKRAVTGARVRPSALAVR
jgi:hypothetical protein